MQARYNTIPEPVTFSPAGNGYTTVVIAINPTEAVENQDGIETRFYWVDYNEFIVQDSRLDKEAIIADPAAWLAFPGDDPQLQKAVIDAVQAHMDEVAQAHGYDNIFTACTYAGDEHPIYGAEGNAAKKWRSACWAFCLQLLDDVRAGKAQKPDTVQEVVAKLPSPEWPELRS